MPGKGHTGERCPACKDTVAALLGRCYGRVEREKQLHLPALLGDWIEGPYGTDLSAIHSALGDHRGYLDFANVAWKSKVDNFVPDPGFVVEFDESQHFTALRAAALDRYPSDLSIGFPIEEWRRHCIEIDAHDNDPVDRDEKRAWYDTLRDFAPAWLGIGPTIRLFSQERQWCALDPNRDEDVAAFRVLIEERLAATTDRTTPLIATVTFRTDREKGPGNNSERLEALETVVQDLASRITESIVVIFPAGFLHSGSAEPRTLYNETVSAVMKAISSLPVDILVVFGIDGGQHSVIKGKVQGQRRRIKADPFAFDDFKEQREVFRETIKFFAEHHRRPDETRRKTTAKDHHPWIDIDSWDRYGRALRPHYELVDWIRHGRNEVTVEFQCESGRCAGLAKAIEAQAETIADAMPGRPAPRPLEERHGWLGLKFVYPGSTGPDEIAGGMRVLLDRSRPIVDAWLEANA